MPLHKHTQTMSHSPASFTMPGVPCSFTLRFDNEERRLFLDYAANPNRGTLNIERGLCKFSSASTNLGAIQLFEGVFPPASGSFRSNPDSRAPTLPSRTHRQRYALDHYQDFGYSVTPIHDTPFTVEIQLYEPADKLSCAARTLQTLDHEHLAWRKEEEAIQQAFASDREAWVAEKAGLVQRHKKTAEYLALLMSSSSPFDVCLDFPRLGRQLWAVESTLLSSPYLASLLSSDFQEGKSSTSEPLSSTKQDVDPYTFDESDDEADAFFLDKGRVSTPQPTTPYKRIVVKDTAYTTYRAVLLWMQTGHIEFAPLHSSFRKDGETVAVAQAARLEALQAPSSPSSSSPSSAYIPLAASPKSIYRLADLLSLDTLKSLALANLLSQLAPPNAAYELYSDVATCYAPVRDAILEYVVERWSEVCDAPAMREMEDRAAAGELPATAMGTAMLLARKLAGRKV